MDLTKLTREQLIETLTKYQKEVDELSTQVNILTESNLKLFNKVNDKTDELSIYKNLYKKCIIDNKKLIQQNLKLLDDVEHLEFSVKKQRALAITACIQAKEAKRLYKHDLVVNNINIINNPCTMYEVMSSDDVILDNIGFYQPLLKNKP
jgi:uncharacterized protein YjcR